MPIPDANLAFVPAEKITNYLLNEQHPIGAGKAKWFRSLGYDVPNPADLERDLRTLVSISDDFIRKDSPFGVKYVVSGLGFSNYSEWTNRELDNRVDCRTIRRTSAAGNRVSRRKTMNIAEHDVVVLTRNLPEFGLRDGDVGTAVHVYADGKAYEVEFITGSGRTLALETLEAKDLRPLGDAEILHSRRVTLVTGSGAPSDRTA